MDKEAPKAKKTRRHARGPSERGVEECKNIADQEMEKERSYGEKLRQALEEEQKKSNDYLDRLKRLQADFENSMRRVKQENDSRTGLANEQLMLEIFPLKDELERALEVVHVSEEITPIVEGLKMILRHFEEVLVRVGVTEISAVGEVFDPLKHEAVRFSNRDDLGENLVFSEDRKGYMFGPKVLRTSLVGVTLKGGKPEVESTSVSES